MRKLPKQLPSVSEDISIWAKDTPDYLMSVFPPLLSVTVLHNFIMSAKMVFILKTNYLAPLMSRALKTLDINQNPLKTNVQSSMRTEPIQSLLLLEYESYIQSFLSCLPVFPQATAPSSNRASLLCQLLL